MDESMQTGTTTDAQGHAADEARGVALVLEGGGYRGVFTAGVLDVLMEAGIYGFSSVWGTSAGALNATSFRSRQIGRSIRIMLSFRDDRRLMSFFSLATKGDMAGGDFLYHTVQEELDPCDVETFNASDMRMFAVASDLELGQPHYLEIKRLPDDVEMIRASSSLPLVSKSVEIDGRLYQDGGTCDSVAAEVALGLQDSPFPIDDFEPARKALVVLTRDRTYQKGDTVERLALASRRYKDHPLYEEALRTRTVRYMEQRERLWELERAGRILALMPQKPVEITVTEHDGGRLLDLYLQGRREAADNLDRIRAFVES